MIIWIGVILTVTAAATGAETAANYKLPSNIKPSHYKLDLTTDLENFKFNGEVWIQISCLQPTSTIVLHSAGLNIGKSEVTVNEQPLSDNSQIKVVDQQEDKDNDFYIIKVDTPLKSGGKYLLYIPFAGVLEPSLSGYYRSFYLDKGSNTTKWIAVTQFEPSDARRAFPCFDEPEMKAKFTIRLAHKDTLSAISNMPLIKTTPIPNKKGWSLDEFQESVPMSTYLVAWLVSDFSHGDAAPRPNNVKFRIWARSEAIDQAEYAGIMGPQILEFYEGLFGVKYPLPKQDMAAVPDFSAGAMENWGLITFRETELLYDSKNPSIFSKERVAYVVAHELAHQWFGNLVTMKWWTDLWLNEGFATYAGTLGVENVLPELNYLKEASLSYLVSVYDLDSLKSSHPISVKVGPPSDVAQIFDAISYKKGSSVIRMMHHFLGDSFKTAVSNYLKIHKYSNAEQDDLWEAMTEQAHLDKVLPQSMSVKEIMDSWTLQTGYPLLTVERDYAEGKAYVSQERFLKIPPETTEETNETCWWVPLTYTTQGQPDFNDTAPKDWLKCGQEKAEIQNLPVGENEWLIVNVDLSALVRVMYDAKNWELIINTMNSDNYQSIGTLNRAGLLLDVFDFAQRGDLTYETALKMSSYLSRETEYIPLLRGFTALGFIQDMLHRSPNYGIYKNYMKKILVTFSERYSKLSAQPETIEDMKIHHLVSGKFCDFGVGSCIDQAKAMFSKWANADLDNSNPIPVDLQGIVLCNAVKYGDESTWNKLWERYLVSNSAAEKAIILRALSCSREMWILNRYLHWSIDENSQIRKQDSLTVFVNVASGDTGFYLAWDFLEINLKKIFDYHQPRTNKMGRYLGVLGNGIMHQNELDRLRSLIESNSKYFETSQLQVQQSLENAMANIKWQTNNYEKVSALLAT